MVKLAAARLEIRRLTLDRDLFEGFQTVAHESRADHVNAPELLPAELGEHVRGIRLEPLRAAEARLERDPVLFLLQRQRFREQAPRLLAFAVVGIALVERRARHAVKAHQQHVGAVVPHPVVAHALRQRAEVAGMIVEMPHRADRRLIAHAGKAAEGGVQGGCRGAGGILGVERHQQDAVAVLGLYFLQLVRDRGPAVAHRVVHHQREPDALAEVAAQQRHLALGVHPERGALVHPDPGVALCRGPGPRGEHEQMQNRPPHEARNLDHPRVGQKLLQIGAHCGRGRRFRRAEIDQQDADPGIAAVRKGRFRREASH